jgi:hypothetical protein
MGRGRGEGSAPVSIAFQNAVINKFPADCEAELLALYAAKVDEVEFKGAI